MIRSWRGQTGQALDGKVALITGGGRGLGLTTAEAYLKAGAGVAILDRDAASLENACRDLTTAGLEPLAIQADIRHEEEVDAAVERAKQWFGRVDVLVNNAAVLM